MEASLLAWLLEPPIGVALGMSVEKLLAPSGRKRSTPPRPQNAFILFRINFMALHWVHHREMKLNFKDINSRCANEWRNALPVVKEYFHMLSNEARRRHAINFSQYKYKQQMFRRKRRWGCPVNLQEGLSFSRSAFVENRYRKRKASFGGIFYNEDWQRALIKEVVIVTFRYLVASISVYRLT